MVAVITANNRAGRDNVAPPPAVKDDGEGYEWRMFYEGNMFVADADTPAELIEILIPGYSELDDEERLFKRIEYAKEIKVDIVTTIIARSKEEQVAALRDWEYEVVNSLNTQLYGWSEDPKSLKMTFPFQEQQDGEEEPEQPDVWSSDLPLVLIDVEYQPHAFAYAPLSSHGDFKLVSNLVWLEPSDELKFLDSFSRIGLITFGQPAASDRVPKDAIED